MTKPKVYVASPLGFSEAGRQFYKDTLLPMIRDAGYEVLDPWDLTPKKYFNEAEALPPGMSRDVAFHHANSEAGKNNARAIEECDLLLAVLDGSDVDSGVAAEIGYATAKGKTVVGYRGDFRQTGENDGCLVNIQVQYFIEISSLNSCIVQSVDDLKSALTDLLPLLDPTE